MFNIAAAGLAYLGFTVSVLAFCGIAYVNADRLERWVHRIARSRSKG